MNRLVPTLNAAEKIVKWVPYRPSNGVEGDFFVENFCERCRRDENQDCPIYAATLSFQEDDPNYPKEWVIPEDADEWPGDAKCTAFEVALK